MDITITVEQGASKDYMLIVLWPQEGNGLEIGTKVLWPAVEKIGMALNSFAMFPNSAVLFPPLGEAMRYLQGMLDALKKHPATSTLTVHVKWSSPELRDAIMRAEEM
ncbi:MAG: hypothetical protein A3C82_02735 [Candidatus Wildermuthbacteria bacterium RIFCSPHIGHO2_02_FULL_47_12]|uniref:Uncharacterized protein n=1 Tax=Candidatus Wildermuthbacteria bacterium RIFCSPHIGHO2_02_FULL_47_12 TaxID=1802451 RepID=A0A1G2R293_9BACT|nr:MAG: hypothetical protein A3C82_02735 [Candidatus Wildermuthbacteria bacterium RIFCSPHIGHO2_02_FULL_47_12]